MIKFLKEYSLFILKYLTVLISLFLIVVVIFSINNKTKESPGIIVVKDLTGQYHNMRTNISNDLSLKSGKKILNSNVYQDQDNKNDTKTYVIKFEGDAKASGVYALKKEINAILSVSNTNDKVVLLLESSGGIVSGYGLATSELERLTNKGLHLTVLIDKVAASGGYMMAAVGNEIISTPFSIIGSIGVISEIPNFNRLLEKSGIKYEQVTSGKHKRVMSMFARNSEEVKHKLEEDLVKIHNSFKMFIKSKRNNVDIESVSTGEFWIGTQAKGIGLVDNIMTSDDYLTSLYMKNEQVFMVQYKKQGSFFDTLIHNIQTSNNILSCKKFLTFISSSEKNPQQR